MSHKCDQCDYTTGQKVSLRRHQLAIHVGQKRECSFCNKMYKWEVDLRKHVTSYHQDKKFTCDDCGQVFEQRRSFLSHRKGVHEKATRKCNISKCDFQVPLGRYTPMSSHKWEKLKEYRCYNCDYKATVRRGVTKHMDQCDEIEN